MSPSQPQGDAVNVTAIRVGSWNALRKGEAECVALLIEPECHTVRLGHIGRQGGVYLGLNVVAEVVARPQPFFLDKQSKGSPLT